MSSTIKTTFLIMSDTHRHDLSLRETTRPVDVVIHCGNLTKRSKLSELRATLNMLESVQASLKLVIAGNHDVSLDQDAFAGKIEEEARLQGEPIGQIVIDAVFGKRGEARKLLEAAKRNDIFFLDEGMHYFRLSNGAELKVYASPYTPSKKPWGFTYQKGDTHNFDINPAADIVITHGPPYGVMDMTSSKRRLGSPQLFEAVARAQPRLHCFGNVHGNWGAKSVTWRPEIPSIPSPFNAIDNGKADAVYNLTRLRGWKYESDEDRQQREARLSRSKNEGCYTIAHQDDGKAKTLFVSAALERSGELAHLPWAVEMDMPAATI